MSVGWVMRFYITRDELENLLRNEEVMLHNSLGEVIRINLSSKFNVVDMLNRLKLESGK